MIDRAASIVGQPAELPGSPEDAPHSAAPHLLKRYAEGAPRSLGNLPRSIADAYRLPYGREGEGGRNGRIDQGRDRGDQDGERGAGSRQGVAPWTAGNRDPILPSIDGDRGCREFGGWDYRFRECWTRPIDNRCRLALVSDVLRWVGSTSWRDTNLGFDSETRSISLQSSRIIGCTAGHATTNQGAVSRDGGNGSGEDARGERGSGNVSTPSDSGHATASSDSGDTSASDGGDASGSSGRADATAPTDRRARGDARKTLMLYHVHAVLNPGVNVRQLQAALNPAHSWYMLSATSWLVCTQEAAEVWVQRLTPHTQPAGAVFVSRLDIDDHYGRMTPEFWAWFRTHTDQNT